MEEPESRGVIGRMDGREVVSKRNGQVSAQAHVVFPADGCAHYTRDPRLGACRLVWSGGPQTV